MGLMQNSFMAKIHVILLSHNCKTKLH